MKNRRDFLKKMAGFTTAIMAPLPWTAGCSSQIDTDRLGALLPKRLLGKTGRKVTMLGLGGYHIGWTTEYKAQETIEAALQGGIRFFDNAESYGPHTSEIRYGKYLTPQYRDLVFIMTKTTAKDAKTARAHLEASLKRMNTDYVDLWQVHALSSPEDVDERISNGILDVMQEAKANGKAKHIGFTGHENPYAHVRMLEKTVDNDIFETIQMPINPVDAGNKDSFIAEVIQTAHSRKFGILAMKTLAAGRFFPETIISEEKVWESEDPVIPARLALNDVLNFAWSLPISVLITGAENRILIEEKISIAKNFVKLSESQRIDLISKVEDISVKGDVEYYKNV